MSDQTSRATPRPDPASSHIDGSNALYLEQQYARYKAGDPSLGADWRAYFAELDDGIEPHRPSWQREDWPPKINGEMTAVLDGQWPEDMPNPQSLAGKLEARLDGQDEAAVRAATLDSIRAIMMIRAYRFRGHLAANLDPLGIEPPGTHPELDPTSYGFTEADYDRPIFIDNVLGLETASIRDMLDILRRTYCGTVALEFMHISDPEEKAWLQERIEGPDKEIAFTDMGKQAIFQKLVEAEGLEQFIDVKYTGTKRFGLDGGEAMIPALEQIIKRGGNLGVKEIVIGMPHRGRLNVLTNVMGKPFEALFHEFKGGSANPEDIEGSGDVKYHLGASSDRQFDGNKVHLSLSPNPSHLEAVDPVVLGKARAKQDQFKDDPRAMADRSTVIPLLLHGDAAFAGQGIVAECLGLSGLIGHKSGGSIHFIVNNQIGFTTNPRFSRSSPYPSDVAKMVEAPIFHVNGDDPEAVVFAAKVATEFRQKFLKPVVIDMFCYRRHGHNEGDEPAFTQPTMYKKIKAHASVVEKYGRRLVAEKLLPEDGLAKAKADYRAQLDEAFEAANSFKPNKADWLDGKWSGIERKSLEFVRGDTGVPRDILREVGAGLTRVPEGFNLHRALTRQLKAKDAMFESGEGFDWATAEALAFGSLLLEDHPVRLVGQDSERGTFSQRHSAWIDQETERRYKPLKYIRDEQVLFEVINSMLSENAVLGFEYGYSLAEPNTLVLWEAQFGDFANGAQVVVDQFISSGENKWLRMSGLVMLLPHGYEGQGPEHSSARLERYLQLCAEENMQVANCTTPANYFHILRRQLKRNFRKPLILMTPKSLLRHKKCVSSLAEMETGSSFHRVLWDDRDARQPKSEAPLKPAKDIRRVVMCSGKVYYDLLEKCEAENIDDVYLMRLEQLYPVPHGPLLAELDAMAHAEMVWCQEEPRNMGAWSFIEPALEEVLVTLQAKHKRAVYAGRSASASTASGLMSRHMEQREAFLNAALSDPID
jgi:2-oxoglutarate dehydrogenase E1 component